MELEVAYEKLYVIFAILTNSARRSPSKRRWDSLSLSEHPILAVLPYVVIMYCFTTPIRLFSRKAPLWYLLQYAAFNIVWHSWFIWIFGATLYGMML